MMAFLIVCVLILLVIISLLIGTIRTVYTNKILLESIVVIYEAFSTNIRDDETLNNIRIALCAENAVKHCLNNNEIDIELIREMLRIRYGNKELIENMTDAEAIRGFALMIVKLNKNHISEGDAVCK